MQLPQDIEICQKAHLPGFRAKNPTKNSDLHHTLADKRHETPFFANVCYFRAYLCSHVLKLTKKVQNSREQLDDQDSIAKKSNGKFCYEDCSYTARNKVSQSFCSKNGFFVELHPVYRFTG